jgi:hypothetical protein
LRIAGSFPFRARASLGRDEPFSSVAAIAVPPFAGMSIGHSSLSVAATFRNALRAGSSRALSPLAE